ncbi:uncharacterized protein LOC131997798 [Stomoxys calcitrans]|uniref:uncharacterized protein LOC131994067 n=1 Tax=Stomoxys calcitrans TaxID=35570 RepID=UPI0027E25B99|nr:uncharacterized protein LOC131994067 [Stomoxys calcitrans]XP_059216253.1 uncharacterized protein LOC131994067 [Stomoxys calcitrans]XP_059216254.1 uncharacterized protein LOC131994067 [Stomoxys calcitrans]XP_059216255.1 uncharacterized protein LOC131994067 [Stomoxys calcitrans]XP_059216825.1 uncharacterized protein LOC131994234 [Stomoxys calcitrans]XP_059216826.1 uncharacterized protein LOC131994234 [Stomoxys calcitrans]XP_059216827.1 uncharacterized protein LOC131994234 [Stomoxys calcitran
MRVQDVYKCMVCQNRHALRYCPSFILMTVEDRRTAVRQHKYCRNCLAKSHTVEDCQSTETCRKCGFQHHTMLHPRKLAPKPKSSKAATRTPMAQPRRQEPKKTNNGQSTSAQAQRDQPAKSRLGRRQNTAAARQQQPHPKRHNGPQNHRNNKQANQRNTQQRINRKPKRKPQRKPTKKPQHQPTNQPPTLQPNYLILSEAIKSLATVLCATPSNFA